MVVRGNIIYGGRTVPLGRCTTSSVSHRLGRWRILRWFLLARRYPGRIHWCIHWRLQRRDPIFKGANPPPHVGIDGVDFIKEGLPFLGKITYVTVTVFSRETILLSRAGMSCFVTWPWLRDISLRICVTAVSRAALSDS